MGLLPSTEVLEFCVIKEKQGRIYDVVFIITMTVRAMLNVFNFHVKLTSAMRYARF